MTELQGNWHYQSFVSVPADVDRTKPPTDPAHIKRLPLIASAWTPPSVMNFVTDAAGNITGSAQLKVSATVTLVFDIKGSIKPAVDAWIPEGIELVVTVAQTASVYHLQGYFLKDSDHIVGTVVVISNDLAFQPHPVGTSGPFVLYPVQVASS
jgi:hypothetical protein